MMGGIGQGEHHPSFVLCLPKPPVKNLKSYFIEHVVTFPSYVSEAWIPIENKMFMCAGQTVNHFIQSMMQMHMQKPTEYLYLHI